ncbi:MAG: hypothetical protein HC866_11390 [Leptolyngbyaceae cyanobacterium RU_5_1]|nr:hypothetical protein [Leptolyngbyaceae cyanobacterium RU_5_1]
MNSNQYVVPHGTIKEYRCAVYFESLALWKEQNPVYRANIARQLADLAATLAELEAEAARNVTAFRSPTS